MGLKREREEACHICGHYHDYEGGEPCNICGHMLEPADAPGLAPSALPTELLPGFLFLGSYDHTSRVDLLKTLDIKYILNTVPTCVNLYKNSFDYHTVTTSPPSFEECYVYLEGVQQAQGKVLLHCMTGTSRSPAVAAYYLMRAHQQRLDQAYAYLKAKRPAVNFNSGDAGRLQEAEIQLFGANASGFIVPVGRQETMHTCNGGGPEQMVSSPVGVQQLGGGEMQVEGGPPFVYGERRQHHRPR